MKTVEECGISPETIYQIKPILLIRIRLDHTKLEKNIVEFTITKDNFRTQLDETLKNFRKQYGVNLEDLNLMPDQIGVSGDFKHCWRIGTLDADVYVVDYIVKRQPRTCHVM